MNLQNNGNRKRGAFAQLQDAFEQVKAEVAGQLNNEFGEMLPGFNKYAMTKHAPTRQQSASSQRQTGTTRQQSRSLEQQPRPPAPHSVRPQQQQRSPSASQNLSITETHGRAHALVSNLNATSARDAIILSEIIGKPLSKRSRTQ